MKRPTYANVAATLALTVALGGTAYAAGLPKNSVGNAQLKKNAVTSAKVKGGTLAPSDLSKASKKLARSGPTVASASVRSLPTNNSGVSYSYGPVQGVVTHAESVFRSVTPDVALTVSGFTARIEKDLVAGTSVTVTLHVADNPNITSSPSTLACTITGTSATTDKGCESASSLKLAPASFVWIVYSIDGDISHVADPGSGYTGLLMTPKA